MLKNYFLLLLIATSSIGLLSPHIDLAYACVGKQDIVGGTQFDDHGGSANGQITMFYMNATDSTSTNIISSQEFNSSTVGMLSFGSAEQIGFSMDTIDVNSDGVDELLVTAEGYSTGRGRVHLIYIDQSDFSVTDSKQIQATGLSADDRFGSSVANVGDVDDDGVPDIAVGARQGDDAHSNTGEIYIMFMNSDGTVKSQQKISETTGGGPNLSSLYYYGSSVEGMGDFDGDGIPDVMVGARGSDAGGGDRGQVWLHTLNADGTVKSTTSIYSATANGPSFLQNSDQFGYSLANLGDLDGDGGTDVGFGYWDNTGNGAWGVMYFDPLHDGSLAQTINMGGGESGAFTGSDIDMVGDWDNNGVNDVVVGKAGDDTTGANHGAILVAYMADDGLSVKSSFEINSSTTNGPTTNDHDQWGFGVSAIGDFNGDCIAPVVEEPSTEVLISDPTISGITPNGATVEWLATGNTDVEGYAIQTSFDNSTWTFLNENTGLISPLSYYLSPFDFNTMVSVRLAEVSLGVNGSWSNYTAFTTLSEQAQGGGPVANVKNTIAPEDLTPEFVPPPPKTGLTELSLFTEDAVRIAPGDTKNRLLEIVWEGDTNLRIEEIIVDESTGLSFAFQQPIEFTPSGTGRTTSEIPYTLEATTLLCTETQTATCVFNEAIYDIPTQVFAESNNESVKFNTFVKVNVTDTPEFGTQEIFFVIIGLIAVAVVIGSQSPNIGDPRKKVLKQKRRPKF